jgi:hypothetical protein
MKFDKAKYLSEMNHLLHKAIQSMKETRKDFIIYSANIWTDPNAACSAINFDSKENSDTEVENLRSFNKKYFDHHMKSGDIEQAKLFEPEITRNCNPASFELSELEIIENKSFQPNWEELSQGACWDELEEALKDIASESLQKLSALSLHPEFELSVNGREDWYMFTWRLV